MMRGDLGRLYFMIHKDDLHGRRFDRVWLILQVLLGLLGPLILCRDESRHGTHECVRHIGPHSGLVRCKLPPAPPQR
jgi:alkanesulfonate monooxygenase SsuD/methylene tetrahydromethanopterin reductase-like flavin-dependent oxidoreductase (luciferase family)